MNIHEIKKIFISSTAYDLIDLRAEVVNALSQWGLQTVNHENPDFPIPSGMHSHDVCLEAVKQSDIFMLIIDERYGGVYTGQDPQYQDKNLSITRCEANVAYHNKKKFHAFVRDNVWNERKTYNNLKANGKIDGFIPSHVDNIATFEFINEIVRRDRDNWVTPFMHSVELKKIIKGRLSIGKAVDIFSLDYYKSEDNED